MVVKDKHQKPVEYRIKINEWEKLIDCNCKKLFSFKKSVFFFLRAMWDKQAHITFGRFFFFFSEN